MARRARSATSKRQGVPRTRPARGKTPALDTQLAKQNRDRPMLRKSVPLDQTLALLRKAVETGRGAGQSAMALNSRGRPVHVLVRIARRAGSYWVHWQKYADMSTDAKPYLDIERSFASLELAIEWTENKTRIPFADFTR